MSSFDIKKITNVLATPAIAGVAAAGIVAITTTTGSADLFGMVVPFSVVIGAIVAAGSLLSGATSQYVLPMIAPGMIPAYLMVAVEPLWTGALASGVDYFYSGSSETMALTFMAGFAGEYIANMAGSMIMSSDFGIPKMQ